MEIHLDNYSVELHEKLAPEFMEELLTRGRSMAIATVHRET